MSDKAWTDSLYIEMRQQYALGNKHLLICPGNYGQNFIKNTLGIDIQNAVKCSNFIGEALDFAVDLSFESLLLIGHAGKLVKLGQDF
jgi:cobalt-precorrin-5B (C1)-methyltransferase